MELVITGRTIPLKEMSKSELKGTTIGDRLAYRFFGGSFSGVSLLFAEPKGKAASPRILDLTARRLYDLFEEPVVYILPECPAYERERLIDKGVFFVVSDKYAHLPMLVANERLRRTKASVRLTPSAQYILLYHLQVESLEGLSAREVSGKVPYSYPVVAAALTGMEDVGLCVRTAEKTKGKILHFTVKGKDLWEKAQPAISSPVEKKVYCDGIRPDGDFPVCGINALAHYTWLNPDPERTVMVTAGEFRKMEKEGRLIRPNDYDGTTVVEVWKYGPVGKKDGMAGYVDRLSLALTLKDDPDPRVEGEVERLINETEWKD